MKCGGEKALCFKGQEQGEANTSVINVSGSGGERKKYNTGCFNDDDDKQLPSPQIISLRLSAEVQSTPKGTDF